MPNLVIIAKFANWFFSEKVKSGFLEALRNGDTQTMVSQMYSKKLSERRNKALEYRKEVKQKNPTVQAYVKNPAILMVKKGSDNKYRQEKEF